MIADDAQHVLAVRLIAGERAESPRAICATSRTSSPVRIAVSAAQIARPLLAVVRNARLHQHRAEVGVAQAERAELVAELGDLLDGKLAISTEISSTIVQRRIACL